MGGLLAGRLADAGHSVTVVDPAPALLEAVRARGILVQDGDMRIAGRVAAVATLGEADPAGVVFVFVKGPHTANVAASIGSVLGPDTTVVTLQNGWGNADVLARAMPAEQLVVGVTCEGATILEPGVVRRTGIATTEVGPYMAGGSTDRAAAIAGLHLSAGFACEVREDVVTSIWRKLIHNAAVLPISAITRLRGAQLVTSPWTWSWTS